MRRREALMTQLHINPERVRVMIKSLSLYALLITSSLLETRVASAEGVEVSEREDATENATESGAEDLGDFGDFGGFDDLPDVELKPSAVPPPPSPLRVDGFARTQWALWTLREIDQGWAKGRQSLDLSARYKRNGWSVTLEGHVEYDLLYLSEGPFDPVQKEEYQTQYIGGIQALSKRFMINDASLTISTGRQIVTWGELDGLSALDVVNPQDQREPGVAEIDDLRIAVWLTRLQYARGAHELEVMVRHEGSYGLLTPPRADYSPFNALLKDQPPEAVALIGSREMRLAHDREGVSADTQSFFARYLYRGAGFDLGVYGASLLDGRGVLSGDRLLKDFPALLQDPQAPLTLTYEHPRYTLTGLTFTKPLKSFLIKGELVGAIDQPVNIGTSESLASLDIAEVNLLTSALSVTYSGFKDITLAAEYQKSSLLGEEPEQPFLFPPNLDVLALRVSSNFLRERLSLSGVVSLIQPRLSGAERGGIIRVDTTYKALDDLHLSLGYIHYLTSDEFGPFYGLEEHDRVFTQLRWNFTLY